MKKEIDIANHVMALLKSQGYSEDTIFIEWKITDRIRVDLAIIDPITKRPIALFEIIRGKRIDIIHFAKEQIKDYARAVEDKTIPLFIVLGKEEDPFFQIFSLTEKDGKDILNPINQMPAFETLRNISISKKIIQTEKAKRKTFDFFWVMCWALAVIIIILLIYDFKGKIKLTSERLAIIAVISGLSILPFARKLNILGVEFERLQKNTSDKK